MTERVKTIQLLSHQAQFVQNLSHRELALVGGFGAGKTRALVYKALYMAQKNPHSAGLLIEPTESLINAVLMPTFEEILDDLQIPFNYRNSASDRRLTLYLPGQPKTEIYLRSATNPRRIVGFNVAWVGIDELDTLHTEQAKEVYNAASSRVRTGEHQQIFCVSTPEGYRFLYTYFKADLDKDPILKKSRFLIKASTRDNKFVSDDYVNSILQRYPAKQALAYLDGEFVNFTNGTVYDVFDRTKQATIRTLETFHPNITLHIGMDFNVNAMAAVIAVIDEKGIPHLVDEIIGEKDTKSMIEAIRKRYGYDRIINIYPDSSGRNASANANASSIALLEQAGFNVLAKAKNPAILDRVNSVNAKFLSANGEIGLRVNIEKCPQLTEGLEKQGWRDGLPDKTSGVDHALDALGYFVFFKYPLVRKASATVRYQ
jgi:phage terminase large subunit